MLHYLPHLSLHATVVDVTIRCPLITDPVLQRPRRKQRVRGSTRVSDRMLLQSLSHRTDGSGEMDEKHWRPWRSMPVGNPTTQGTKAARFQNGETRWNRACRTHNKTSCSGWQRHAGSRLGRQRTAVGNTHILYSERQ